MQGKREAKSMFGLRRERVERKDEPDVRQVRRQRIPMMSLVPMLGTMALGAEAVTLVVEHYPRSTAIHAGWTIVASSFALQFLLLLFEARRLQKEKAKLKSDFEQYKEQIRGELKIIFPDDEEKQTQMMKMMEDMTK